MITFGGGADPPKLEPSKEMNRTVAVVIFRRIIVCFSLVMLWGSMPPQVFFLRHAFQSEPDRNEKSMAKSS